MKLTYGSKELGDEKRTKEQKKGREGKGMVGEKARQQGKILRGIGGGGKERTTIGGGKRFKGGRRNTWSSKGAQGNGRKKRGVSKQIHTDRTGELGV